MAGDPTITVKITGDTSGLGRAARQAESDVQGIGSKISGFAVGAGAAVTTMAINAIPALINVGAELVALGQTTEINLGKSQTVFGDNAGRVATWADSVNESLGMSDEAVIGLAASMGDLLVPLGFTRKAAADMSTETVELSGALSAWSGGAYDAAAVSEILTKAYLGETDGLKALGISINAAEVEQRALEIAQKDGRTAVTAQDKALATQALILEKSTDAQAAWSDGTMDAVKNQNEMKAALDDAKTSIAQGLLPIVQRVTAWIVSDMIPAVRSVVATFQENWPRIQEAVEPVIVWFQETAGEAVAVVADLWEQHGDRIMTFIGIVWSYVEETIGNAIRAVQAVVDVVLGVLSGDWGRAWEGIRDLVGAVWDQITNLIRYALRLMGMLLDMAWESIKGAARSGWESVTSTISGAIDGIVSYVTGIPGRIFGTIYSLWDGLRTGITEAKTWVGDRISEVVGFATGLPGRLSGVFSGMWDGIKSAFRSALNWIIDRWNGLQFTIPSVSAFGVTLGGGTVGTPDIPRLADGGIVRARAGGMLAVIGEGRYDEAVIPLDGNHTLGGGQTTVYQSFPAGTDPSGVVKAQRDWERRNGPIGSAS